MKPLKAVVPFALFIAVSGAVAAQEIPKELLAQDYANCMNGCLEHENRAICEILCGCAIGRFRAELDFAAYNELSAQMARNEVDEKNTAFLAETGRMCEAELERAISPGPPQGEGE